MSFKSPMANWCSLLLAACSASVSFSSSFPLMVRDVADQIRFGYVARKQVVRLLAQYRLIGT